MRLFSLKMVFSMKIVKYLDRDTFEKDCLFYFRKKAKIPFVNETLLREIIFTQEMIIFNEYFSVTRGQYEVCRKNAFCALQLMQFSCWN